MWQVIIVVLLVGIVIACSVAIVPEKRWAIVERLGRFQRRLDPGLHYVIPLLDRLKYFKWGNVERDSVPMTPTHVDIKPVKCQSKDRVYVELDGYYLVSITDPIKVVYEISDPGDFINQCIIQAIRNIVAKIPVEELNAHDNELGVKIVEYANKKCTDKGICVDDFLVQNLTIDNGVWQANQQQVQKQRKSETEKQQALARQQLEQSEAKHRLQLVELDNETLLAEARGQASKEAIRLKALRDTGFTHEQIVEIERARLLGEKRHTFMFNPFALK